MLCGPLCIRKNQDLNKENWGDMKKLGKGRERANGKGKHSSVMGELGEEQDGIPSQAQAGVSGVVC